MPSTFDEDGQHWTYAAGSPSSAPTGPSGATFPTVSGVGKVWQSAASYSYAWTKGTIRPVAGRTYKVSVRWRVATNRTGGTAATINLQWTGFDEAYAIAAYYLSTGDSAVAADGWKTTTLNTSPGATYAHIRPLVILNAASEDAVFQVQSIVVEDVTDSLAAAASASSASTSASTATTQASSASASAASAASSATLAATYYGKGNRNLFPNPSGNGSGASAIGSGLWSGVFGGDTSGSTWKQARYDWLGGNIYLEDWSAYSSGTARAYYVDIPLTNGGYQNYTVSWIGWKAGFTSAPYVQAYILDSGGGTVATSSAPALDNFYSGVRSSVTVGSSGGTGVTLRLYVVIPVQTVGAYCAAMISQIKLEIGSSMTSFTDDTSVNNLNVGLVTANANIATNASAIATESAARAAADTTLTASLGTTNANVSTNASAIATVDGKLSASYALTVDGNGRIASMKLLSDGTTSSVKFTASTFQIYNGTTDVPMFEVSGGAAYVAGSKVRTESMTPNAITAADDDETDAGQNVGSSWVAVADCSLTTVDAASRALIMFSAYIESSTDGSLMDARIKRDSTVIWGPKSIAGDPPEFSETFEDEGLIEYRPMFNGMVSFFDTDVPGSAATFTYTVELRVAGSVSTPWVASYRRMFGLIFKR